MSHHVALNGDDGADALPAHFLRDGDGVVIRPAGDGDVARRFPDGFFRIDAGRGTTIERVGGDEELFLDGRSRRQPFVTVVIATTRVGLAAHHGSSRRRARGRRAGRRSERGGSDPRPIDSGRAWSDRWRCDAPSRRRVSRSRTDCRDILPWLAHNAMIHYLAPRGLEQYSGGGWGTRDVCQGPVEMLLALGRWEPLRDLLLRVFKTQNADGDWPQWFMFFERERGIRPADSHGDIVFWPLLALAQYLIASDDASILDDVVPFFHPEGDDRAEKATIWGHVERALKVIAERVIPGTSLAAYGHGDWNDSLQPVDPAMCERLCSAWTVTLHHQTLTTLAKALRRAGRVARRGVARGVCTVREG